MNARISPAERVALPVARAALESRESAYGAADTIVFALGAAGLLATPEVVAAFESDADEEYPSGRVARMRTAMGAMAAARRMHGEGLVPLIWALENAGLLQSPETAAELVRLREAESHAKRYRIAWRMAHQRAKGRGWAADRAGARSRELQTALQDMLGSLLAMQMERDAAIAEVERLSKAESPAVTVPPADFVIKAMANVPDSLPRCPVCTFAPAYCTCFGKTHRFDPERLGESDAKRRLASCVGCGQPRSAECHQGGEGQ